MNTFRYQFFLIGITLFFGVVLIVTHTIDFVHASEKPSFKVCVVSVIPPITCSFMMNQITGLVDRGCDVYMYTFGGVPGIAAHENFKKYDLEKKTCYGKGWFHRNIPQQEVDFLRKFDVFLCETGLYAERFMPLKKKYNLSGRVATCFRGDEMNVDPKDYTLVFEMSDLVLPICKDFKRKLVAMGCDSKKIKVLHSAIDTNKFSFKERSAPADGSITIVSTNRLVERKGTEYAIRAIAKVLKKYPNVTHQIVGDGPLRDDLESLIKELGVEGQIKILGWKNPDEIVDILDNAHMLVLASVTAEDGNQDGPANVLKEAMAMGLPVISTEHGGIPEIVEEGKNGFLVPERDVDAMAECIEYLIAHPETWSTMAKAGRAKVEQEYDMEKENDKLYTMLTNLR